ncbi:single-stranded-DNA-specific exonuclease RecJ [Mariprofundus ferrooxydans]|uniref:Single-stranded-DNA-specific exonuclease RecJ n=1 Tax=Mariprofundus ferrooxydans PV-1 TaxID=314345 RepID=Q0F3M9_9PROT|nr:single-stranded-DNA-specific exonuclease RecJ [Mariprofundus ferrooxydans]EAU55912.1 single-stranded-DNA-specific exonuclease RecJ [Mariprofundus ferrooxydans PV-1]KON48190.1 single-stranded DNA exonuclease RecJ [Mariprofundus ferrooxydans]
MSMSLPEQRTAKGRLLQWRNGPLAAADPLAAWQGLLDARGLTESDDFFSPRLADLPDPFAMKDMDKAATRLARAIGNGEAIHIFGDFDADGVNGTAILVEALRAAGATVTFSIPHRADDGHGVGVESVRQVVAESACRMGLSVDTGTTCFDACDEAARLGFDLIISDHHLPEATLPAAFALLNPARSDCGFAERALCGTGVAFFLLMAVWKKLTDQGNRPAYDLRALLDRVAVATVADVMDLVGVNRILVAHGLQRLNSAPSIGMAALMQVARVNKTVTAETIGFHLAPRINAAGRMQHGEAAMRLLSTSDAGEALRLAEQLDETNKQRRKVEVEVFKQAEEKLADTDVLAVYDERWHAGVVGLAAGRLARKHGRPAAVGFVTPEGDIRVSLRGMNGFHIGALLNDCSDHLAGFGGHAGAGGGTITAGNWAAFHAAFAAAVARQAEGVSDHLVQQVDGVLEAGAMHFGLAERLARFEPFGRANPPSLWLLRDIQIAERRNLKGNVVRLKLTDGSRWLDGIVFGAGAMNGVIEQGMTVSLIGQLQKDDYRGGQAIQFVIEDAIAPA